LIDAATVATLAFQWLGAALNFLIGLVALRIGSSEARARPIHLAGWSVVGTALLFAGVVDVFQTSTAVLAVALGPGSFVYDQYVRWAMAMNHSRTGAEIAMGLVLAWLAVRGSPSARGPAAAPWIIVAGLALGALGGVRTDGFLFIDFLAIAASNTLELAVLGVALLLALIRSSIDWILWVAVAIKMLSQGINVLIFTTLVLVQRGRRLVRGPVGAAALPVGDRGGDARACDLATPDREPGGCRRRSAGPARRADRPIHGEAAIAGANQGARGPYGGRAREMHSGLTPAVVRRADPPRFASPVPTDESLPVDRSRRS